MVGLTYVHPISYLISKINMKKLDVAHFLAIYKIRMRMQKSGVTNPTEEVKRFTREFVTKLESMPRDKEVRIINKSFVDSDGNVIAKIPIPEK